jgi:hypothetical protein
MSSHRSFVRAGSSRLYVPRGYTEGEVWAMRSQFVPRRYFSMMVQSGRFGSAPVPPNTYYLDTDAGGGGDGSIGTPWNTMESARAGLIALHASLVTDTVNPTVICFGNTEDTTAVTNTWPTSSTTYYSTWKVPDADRVVEWDDTHYVYSRSAGGVGALAIGTNSIRLLGLQIKQTSTTNLSKSLEITSAGGEHVYDGCKFRGAAGTNSIATIVSNIAGRYVLRNCMSWGCVNGFIFGSPTALPVSTEVDMYNCTCVGNAGGTGEAFWVTFAAGGTGKIARVKNCFARQIFHGVTITNSNTSDTATNVHTTVLGSSFNNAAAGDFRLVVGDTAAKDLGTDLSGVADFPFTDDASLYTRPFNGTWDIGMHEYR